MSARLHVPVCLSVRVCVYQLTPYVWPASSVHPASMEQATASSGAMAAGSAGGSVAVAAASAPPTRVSFEFPTDAEQTEYVNIDIRMAKLKGTTKEAWSEHRRAGRTGASDRSIRHSLRVII